MCLKNRFLYQTHFLSIYPCIHSKLIRKISRVYLWWCQHWFKKFWRLLASNHFMKQCLFLIMTYLRNWWSWEWFLGKREFCVSRFCPTLVLQIFPRLFASIHYLKHFFLSFVTDFLWLYALLSIFLIDFLTLDVFADSL